MQTIIATKGEPMKKPWIPKLLKLSLLTHWLIYCVAGLPGEGFGATHTSNGNISTNTDVGAWYEVMYDPTMWAKGACGGFSLDYRPLSPKSLVFSANWTVDANRTGDVNNDAHVSNVARSSMQ